MKAAVLVKVGDVNKAFEIRDVEKPVLEQGEVLIKVKAFGLNYADIMARNGLYRAAPPLPSVLGYDVVGEVVEVKNEEDKYLVGKRVVGLTRFGGYAQFAKSSRGTVVEIPDSLDETQATAIATQYCTAYYASQYVTNLHKGEHVLIHAAAGGVGTALTQIAKSKGCIVYGLTSKDDKIDYLKANGVDHPINYNKVDYWKEFKKISGKDKVHVVFNSVGGSTFKNDIKHVQSGGRLVYYGAAQMSGKRPNIFTFLGILRKFGIYSPIPWLAGSKGVIGVNMLAVGDNNPDALKVCMQSVVDLIVDGNNSVKPIAGGIFSINELEKAHAFLESRKSTGKIAVKW